MDVFIAWLPEILIHIHFIVKDRQIDVLHPRHHRPFFSMHGRHLVRLTPEAGHHQAVFTDDMAYLIDTYSTVTTPPVTVLRSGRDGKVLQTLETADITRLKQAGWQPPEVFVAKGRDGVTDMWGIIQRPSNFDPNRSYPVIEYIYSGPGDQYVPKAFTPWLWNLADLAELGFIVVQVDGMTTSFRSLSLHGCRQCGHLRRFCRRPGKYHSGAPAWRFLQGGLQFVWLPRQPHGQDMVE